MSDLIISRELNTLAIKDLFVEAANPLHLDLGTGLGHFTAELAGRFEATNWLAVEYDRPIAGRAAKRISRETDGNAATICADARMFLLECCQANTFDHIWINFPDPWPKERHQARRHANPWMIGLLFDRIKPGGELHLATDVEDYHAEMLAATSDLAFRPHSSEWSEIMEQVQTKYKKKWERAEKQFHYATWLADKKADPAPADPRYLSELAPAPTLADVKGRPEPSTIKQGRYVGKLFAPRRGQPDLVHFLMIDAENAQESPGSIDLGSGDLQLAGRWTTWKRDLFTALFS